MKKLDITNSIIIVSILFCIIIMAWEYPQIVQDNTRLKNNFDSLQALETGILQNSTGTFYGLYYNDFMVLRLNDMGYSEVMEHCNHEYLHYNYDGHFG